MNLSPTSIYVHLGNGKMAAIIWDRENNNYYYQIVQSNCMGIEKEQIVVDQRIGPFEDFISVNKAVDQINKENNK